MISSASNLNNVVRASVPTQTFESIEALLGHWGTIEETPFAWRVRNGPWTAWVRRSLTAFDCTVAIELYGVDPDAAWPLELLLELTRQATHPVKMKRASFTAPMPSLAEFLAGDGAETVFDAQSAPSNLFSEEDWGRALVDRRTDAFGGTFEEEGAVKTIASFIPLTRGEWILREEGFTIAQTRELHEALDRDVLANPYWREAWNAEAGGERSAWLAQQPAIRRSISPKDGARLLSAR